MATTKLPAASSDQTRAWGFYGSPAAASTTLAAPGHQAIGELRFVIGWIADQMSRMGWRVKIDGSENWTVATEEDGTIVSDAEEADLERDTHPVNASRDLLKLIMWDERTVREVATNLFVAGEMHYALDRDIWRVVSVIRADRQKIVDRAGDMVIRGIWPHPADPSVPDAPTFGVLGVLDDMRWLNRLSRAQSANRVGMRGILLVADQLKIAGTDTSDTLPDDLNNALSRSMDDPEDVSPVMIVGPAELLKGSGAGGDALKWTIPDFPYDAKIDARMEKLVERLAYGLPIPPEILLGLQASSRATAFQVEGAAYRAHIEPIALLVSKVASDALSLFLPQFDDIFVEPDPAEILARRHSVQDVLDAYDRGVIKDDYLLEVLGIPNRAKSDEEDLARWLLVNGNLPNAAADDPASIAAIEPALAITAAVSAEAPPKPETPAEEVAALLQNIDTALLHELAGQVGATVTKLWERLGARVRSSGPLSKSLATSTASNEEVGRQLAGQIVDGLGADGLRIIETTIAPLLKWWESRALEAQGQVEEILATGDIVTHFSPTSLAASSTRLTSLLTEAMLQGIGVASSDLRGVLDIAGESS